MKTRIYEIRINGEKEWVCADTIIEALKTYKSITDIDLYDFDNDDDIVEVPKEKWSEMNILDTEAPISDDLTYPVIMTFSEYMRTEATHSDIIASTNY